MTNRLKKFRTFERSITRFRVEFPFVGRVLVRFHFVKNKFEQKSCLTSPYTLHQLTGAVVSIWTHTLSTMAGKWWIRRLKNGPTTCTGVGRLPLQQYGLELYFNLLIQSRYFIFHGWTFQGLDWWFFSVWRFVFAEVNADEVYWLFQGEHRPLKLIQTNTDE